MCARGVIIAMVVVLLVLAAAEVAARARKSEHMTPGGTDCVLRCPKNSDRCTKDYFNCVTMCGPVLNEPVGHRCIQRCVRQSAKCHAAFQQCERGCAKVGDAMPPQYLDGVQPTCGRSAGAGPPVSSEENCRRECHSRCRGTGGGGLCYRICNEECVWP